jgi:hypothetical protein
MRLLSLIALTGVLALGESHPSWWGLAAPDSTALVGIRWENLRQSPFADPIAAELSGLGFPDLAILREARQILISSPPLGIFTGVFQAAALRSQAAAKGMKSANYRGYELWISPGNSTLSVAALSEQLLLIGSRKTLEAALDRSLLETGRMYSPLLGHAARFSQTMDLWVVAAQLPDPLASLFVPFEVRARSFEGGVAMRNGLQLDATLEAESDRGANEAAVALRQSIPGLPEIARGLEVTVEGRVVKLGLDLDQAQLAANLRTAEHQEAPGHQEAPQVPARQEVPAPPESQPANPAPLIAPPPAPEEPPKPAVPQVIRIYGLDEGVREIVIPAKR